METSWRSGTTTASGPAVLDLGLEDLRELCPITGESGDLAAGVIRLLNAGEGFRIVGCGTADAAAA